MNLARTPTGSTCSLVPKILSASLWGRNRKELENEARWSGIYATNLNTWSATASVHLAIWIFNLLNWNAWAIVWNRPHFSQITVTHQEIKYLYVYFTLEGLTCITEIDSLRPRTLDLIPSASSSLIVWFLVSRDHDLREGSFLVPLRPGWLSWSLESGRELSGILI